jgi:DNA-directed RNA polymerase subunit N (RpoN/RPB10)
MLIPILCFSCGCAIGDRGDLFRHMRAKRVEQILKGRGTIARQAAIDVGLQIDCSDILDKLGVVNDCCRTHLVIAMEFGDYY